MLFVVVDMLKKRLGIEAIERNWSCDEMISAYYFKIPSTLIIPDSVERIGEGSLRCCKKLKKVVIPESVKEIGMYSFFGCFGAIVILKKPESVKEVGYKAFIGCRDVKKEIRN